MRVRANSPAQLTLLCCAMAVLTACVNAGPPNLGAGPASPADAAVMTAAEIADSHAPTAYDAIQRSHPLFLMSRVDLAPMAEREVYLNGLRLGGVGELRSIPASSVREIRFVRALDGAAFGIGRPGGAILVISKSGR